MNPTPKPYLFHAFDVSYFSAIVRPALRYKQVWYRELRADVREIIRRTGMHYIPILVTPEDETWQDSTEILLNLEERHPVPPLFPEQPLQRLACDLVELYVDEVGLTAAMHTRWGSELGATTSRKRFIAMTGSEEQGNLAADQMTKARFAVGATDEAGPAIDAHIRDLLDALSAHFSGHPYLLGERMSSGDCALMGLVYGHFFVDLPSRRLLLETATPTVAWIERANFPDADTQGDWPSDGGLSPSLREVLGAMGRDAVPVILAVLRSYDAWADSRPTDLDEPPRRVGEVAVPLRGTTLTRFAGSYTHWNVMRVLDRFRALPASERERAEKELAGTGWEDLLAFESPHRLTKRGFKLAFT
jgi:glutathione S-transferase